MLSFKSPRERGKSPFNETSCTLFFNNNGLFHVKFKACSSIANRFLVGSHNQKQYNWHMSICSDPSFQTEHREQTSMLSLVQTLKSQNFLPRVIALTDLISAGSHAVFHRSQTFQSLLADEEEVLQPSAPSQPGFLLPSSSDFIALSPLLVLNLPGQVFVLPHTAWVQRKNLVFAFVSCSTVPG